MVKGCPRFSPSAKASPMICPQTYRTHSGSSSERKALRFGAKSRATGWVVGGLPWAALRTLTGDVMRRALWVGGIDRSEARSSCFASIKGEETTPATLAKVFNCATTLHRSSSRASRHHRRASGWAETPTDGGRVPRPAATKCAVHAARAARQRGGTTTAEGDGAPTTGPPPRAAPSLGAAAKGCEIWSVATRRGERMPRRGREGGIMGLASRSPPPRGVAAAPQRAGRR